MPQTPNGGSVSGVGSVGNPGMSPFGQPMMSPAPQYPQMQSNGPAPLASPSHQAEVKARLSGGPVASPFMNHSGFGRGEPAPSPSPSQAASQGPLSGAPPGTPATPGALAHPSPAPDPRPASRPASVSAQMAALNAAASADDSPPEPDVRVKREPDEPRVKEEPDDGDCGGKGMRDETPDDKELDRTDFTVKQEIKREVKEEPPEPGAAGEGGSGAGPKCNFAFKPEELRQALMPTLEKLFRQDPESLPFRQPVDAQALGIPDYFDIVTKPIDLSTIKMKLDRGEYKDPWEYVDDVWLMFENAWLYNRKNSRVYRYCTKVS